MPAPDTIHHLVSRFCDNRDAYRSPYYNEEQLRKEFLEAPPDGRETPAPRTDHERAVLQRQIDATDREIDQLVYELYGLTEEQIAIVEGSGGR